MIIMLELDEVKEYLRLDTDAEDEYLNILILLSAEICVNYTREELPDVLPESYKQAMLIIIGYFFEHRDGTKEGIPSVIYALLLPYRRAVF